MELCLVKKTIDVKSWILENVIGLDDRERLSTVIKFMCMAIDAEEFLQEAALQAWSLIEKES